MTQTSTYVHSTKQSFQVRVLSVFMYMYSGVLLSSMYPQSSLLGGNKLKMVFYTYIKLKYTSPKKGKVEVFFLLKIFQDGM